LLGRIAPHTFEYSSPLIFPFIVVQRFSFN
jgi:hypothetical protein